MRAETDEVDFELLSLPLLRITERSEVINKLKVEVELAPTFMRAETDEVNYDYVYSKLGSPSVVR